MSFGGLFASSSKSSYTSRAIGRQLSSTRHLLGAGGKHSLLPAWRKTLSRRKLVNCNWCNGFRANGFKTVYKRPWEYYHFLGPAGYRVGEGRWGVPQNIMSSLCAVIDYGQTTLNLLNAYEPGKKKASKKTKNKKKRCVVYGKIFQLHCWPNFLNWKMRAWSHQPVNCASILAHG